MTHTRIRSLLLALFLVILTFSLTACYTITLKEKRIDGIGSSITVKLPGNPQKLDFPVPVDPLTQRYFKGSRLYGEIDSGLYVALFHAGGDIVHHREQSGFCLIEMIECEEIQCHH